MSAQQSQAATSAGLNVALVGDSVLDDHYWLDRPKEDVREQTERTLRLAYPSRDVQVLNFAVDESTVKCVLRGRRPAAHYRQGRERARMERYPMEEDGVVRPLRLLRDAKPSHVVRVSIAQIITMRRVASHRVTAVEARS